MALFVMQLRTSLMKLRAKVATVANTLQNHAVNAQLLKVYSTKLKDYITST